MPLRALLCGASFLSVRVAWARRTLTGLPPQMAAVDMLAGAMVPGEAMRQAVPAGFALPALGMGVIDGRLAHRAALR